MIERTEAEIVADALFKPKDPKEKRAFVRSAPGKPKRRSCEARKYGYYGFTQCNNAGKVERAGHLFCGVCDPVKKAEKRREWRRKFDEKWDLRQAAERRNAEIDAAKAAVVNIARDVFRQRATFDELEAAVAALDKAEGAT
jgi:hypothetical protein